MPRSYLSSITSRLLLSTALLLGAATVATPAQATDAYSYSQYGGVHTLAYRTIGAVATYRTEARSGAEWMVLDIYYTSARDESIIKLARGNTPDAALEYTVGASGIARSGGSTSAVGSRQLDGQLFHFEIPLADAGGAAQDLNFIFVGVSSGVFSFLHPVPLATPATVSKADYDQCKTEVKTLRDQVRELEVKLGKARPKAKR